jgi:hypothetical protein
MFFIFFQYQLSIIISNCVNTHLLAILVESWIEVGDEFLASIGLSNRMKFHVYLAVTFQIEQTIRIIDLSTITVFHPIVAHVQQ